uniref:Uncharacterized protein n=1 Tax=Ciona savignyi TaxID=51511 RepID=H2ZCN7_CIOSA
MDKDVDKRFESVLRDHRFRSIKHKQKKVQIDGRFQSMFTDKRFKLQYDTDKRGKPVHQTSSENLKKYYRLSFEEKKRLKAERAKKLNSLKEKDSNVLKEIDETENLKTEAEDDDKATDNESSSEYESSSDEDEEEAAPDLARGEGGVETSSDEDEDEYYKEENNLPDQHWNELDADAERTEDVSSRLALCNMDWDRIRALDLFMLFDSFKPVSGSIKSVSIYPSEFGIKRLAEEDLKGPAELRKENSDDEEISPDVDSKEGSKFQREKLRQYQINRLKYYYAVIECDSPQTADAIYQDCDGIEYEASSTKMDLRFIPDGTTFDDHPAKDVANCLPDKDLYKPTDFITKALHQAKVDLTWDETDHRRLAMTMRKFNEDEIANMDVQDFLASSSGSESEEVSEDVKKPKHFGISSRTTDEDQIMRYRSLLLDNDDAGDKKDDVDMEITWEPDLLSKDENKEDTLEEEEPSTGVNSDLDEPKSKKSKKTSKKRKGENTEEDLKKKAELEMLMMDEEDLRKHFNMDDIEKQEKRSTKARKRKNENKDDSFKIDVKDSRFSAVFTAPEFALDPNNPSFRKTKAMKELLQERQTQIQGESDKPVLEKRNAEVTETDSKPKDSSSLSNLVNSIKAKTKNQFAKKRKGTLLNKVTNN